MAKPRYEQIKTYLLDQIEQGLLKSGTKVSSENQLAEQFGVSRMTARRALDDLSDAGFLFRSQGLGTFVSDARPMSSMLEIRNIADEIRDRGHICEVEVLALEKVEATEQQATWLGLKHPTAVFHSVIVYFEINQSGKRQAIQFEERFVNPFLIPDYLQQDFNHTTPNKYLSRVAPLTEADHIVEAVLPETLSGHKVEQHLNIANHEPCLKVTRRTFSNAGIVSVAALVHPGHKFRLGGHIHVS